MEFEITIRGRLPLMDIKLAERLMAAFLNQLRAIALGFTIDLDLPMTALIAVKTSEPYQSPWWVIRGADPIGRHASAGETNDHCCQPEKEDHRTA